MRPTLKIPTIDTGKNVTTSFPEGEKYKKILFFSKSRKVQKLLRVGSLLMNG